MNSLRVWKSLAMILLFVAAGLAMWPLNAHSPGSEVTVKITALGSRNSASKASDIWIRQLPVEMDAAAVIASADPQGSWDHRPPALVSYRNQPATLIWRGRLTRGANIVFHRQDHSGNVEIVVNERKLPIDLYGPPGTPDLEVNLAALANDPVTEPTLDSVLLLIFIAGSIALLRSRRSSILDDHHGRKHRNYISNIILFSLPSLAIFSLVLLGTWPAQMSSDSISQWEQVVSGSFSNEHPVVHTFIFGTTGYIFGSPAAAIALQIFLFAIAIGAVLAELRRSGLNTATVWVLAVLVPAFPPVHTLSSVFWKDIPYTVALVALTAMLLALVRTKGRVLDDRRFMVVLCLDLLLTATIRHNGIVVVVGVVFLIGVLLRERRESVKIAILVAFGIIVPVLISSVVLPVLGIRGLGSAYGGAIPLHVLGKAHTHGLISEAKTRERLDAILPRQRWAERYTCLSSVPLFWAPGIRYDLISADLLWPAVKVALEHPVPIIDHFLCVNSLMWRLTPTSYSKGSIAPLTIHSPDNRARDLGLTYAPKLQIVETFLLRQFNLTMSSAEASALFWRPALFLLVFFFACALSLRRSNVFGVLVISAPFLLNALSWVPLIGAQDYRYHFPTVVLVLLLLPLIVSGAYETAEQAGE